MYKFILTIQTNFNNDAIFSGVNGRLVLALSIIALLLTMRYISKAHGALDPRESMDQ